MKLHCCIPLTKLNELTLKGVSMLDHDNGEPFTETEVYKLVRTEKGKGYKYFAPCSNRDNEGRCKGHTEHSKGNDIKE